VSGLSCSRWCRRTVLAFAFAEEREPDVKPDGVHGLAKVDWVTLWSPPTKTKLCVSKF